MEWLDHLDRWALREPPGCKGQQGHRGNRAQRVTLDRLHQLVWQVPRATQVKKERKASAVKLDQRARLEWLDHRDRSAWQALKVIPAKKERKVSAARPVRPVHPPTSAVST